MDRHGQDLEGLKPAPLSPPRQTKHPVLEWLLGAESLCAFRVGQYEEAEPLPSAATSRGLQDPDRLVSFVAGTSLESSRTLPQQELWKQEADTGETLLLLLLVPGSVHEVWQLLLPQQIMGRSPYPPEPHRSHWHQLVVLCGRSVFLSSLFFHVSSDP